MVILSNRSTIYTILQYIRTLIIVEMNNPWNINKNQPIRNNNSYGSLLNIFDNNRAYFEDHYLSVQNDSDGPNSNLRINITV